MCFGDRLDDRIQPLYVSLYSLLLAQAGSFGQTGERVVRHINRSLRFRPTFEMHQQRVARGGYDRFLL